VIFLAIKRNDPCPCGSGKKYKKCCLQKESIIQLHEVKKEKFFQAKQALVLQVRDFITKQVPPTSYYQLQSEFKKRTNYKIEERLVKGLFQYWLYFFHRFENGLRGIEWFIRETGGRLSEDERKMADTWNTLTPRIVQCVEKQDETLTFEDVFTSETFKVANSKENVPYFAPWFGTITMLEPFEDLHYFNGVRSLEGPDGVARAMAKVQALVEEKNQDHQQILLDYYPEILTALMFDEQRENQPDQEIIEYILHYQVEDEKQLTSFLQDQQSFEIDVWEDEKKQGSLAGSWYQYTDSEFSQPVFLAEVYGKLFIEKNRLKYNSLALEHVNEFKAMIQDLLDRGVLIFLEEETSRFTIPFQAEIRDVMVTLDNDTPKYVALYAQNDIRFVFDRPLRQFDGLSIMELVEAGRFDDADNLLKQIEYNMYLQVKKQFDKVEITADYNSMRKKLGLPLSPFVTGGEARTSTLEVVKANQPVVNEKDIEYLEQLGFTPDTVNNFYSDDIVQFYKEKTDGKSEGTLRKYRSSLFDLRIILESYPTLTSWAECNNEEFWTKVIEKDFPELYETLSKTAIKDFTSTIKAFAKWLK